MRVYMCYQRKDYETAQGIASTLSARGARTFVDKDSIPAGAEWERVLERELESSDAVVLLWSATAAKSPHVMRELTAALLKKRLVIPCALDDTRIPELIEDKQILDYRLPNAAARLVAALNLSDGGEDEPKGTLSLTSAIDAYRRATLQRSGQLRILGRGTDQPLETLYLPLSLTLRGDDGKASRPLTTDALLSSDPRHVVVLGLPGSGKSTLLRHLAVAAVRHGLVVPIYVRIAALMATNDSLIVHIESQIAAMIGRRAAETLASTDTYCRAGTLLLLDGLDEISAVDEQEFHKRLGSFMTGHPDCGIVITSRLAGFSRKNVSAFGIADLQPLTPGDIEQYIWRVCSPDDRTQIWRTIKGNARLFELARTPFLLALMCAAPDAVANRAAQRAKLFEACIKYLLKQQDWQEAGPGRPRLTDEQVEVLERVLETVAVRFFKLDVREAFREEEIQLLIRSIPGSLEMLHPGEILERITQYTGLLQRVGSGIDFVHRSIWEYFVARGMRSEPLENLLQRATASSWEEPIRLYVGLSAEREMPEVLSGLWQHNKGLALRSMMELAIFPDEILRALVNPLDRVERVRLIFQLGESLEVVPNPIDAARMLVDTISALARVERDAEVLFRAIALLETWAEEHGANDGRDLVSAILDLSNAAKRRRRYLEDESFRLAFVWIPPGDFVMGTDDHDRTPDEKPAHPVRVNGFWLSRFQITNKLYYDAFPSSVDRREVRSNRDAQPVTYVTWYEAALFALWLGCDLPTEAEWEYAARSGGLDDRELYDYAEIPKYAWYVENSQNETHDVGSLQANRFGVHDMLGNVREWCKDWFDGQYYAECAKTGLVVDPLGPSRGTRKSLRGGCFDWNITNLVPTYKNYNPPDNSYFTNGFRVVCRGAQP